MYDARGGTEDWRSMNEERISLRLGSEELRVLDEFLKMHPEYTSRSQLARIALRSFIEGKHDDKAIRSQGTEVMIRVPRLALRVIEGLVRAGVYNSISEAIEECVRREFVSKSLLEEIKKRLDENECETLEIVPDSGPLAGKSNQTGDE
ncbi:MAG: ribbon-helix-helix domain-containing protein [Methanomassiliicoccales archaeon]|jgi:Arc/MetJ-type ribon-helix-helix transcriptional regulator|nr:ribbon-helix-helix domain-containing protein [Methanomassiliicoccales archaeon]